MSNLAALDTGSSSGVASALLDNLVNFDAEISDQSSKYSLLADLRSILLGYRSCSTSSIIHPNSIFCVFGFSLQDRCLFHELFRSCLKCFSIIAIPWDLKNHLADCKDLELAGLTHPLPLNVLPQEDKELVDLFSYSFTIIEVAGG